MRHRLAAGVLVLVAAPAALGACSGGRDTSRPISAANTSSDSPQTASTSPATRAGRAAVAAYDNAFRAEIDALGSGDATPSRLSPVMTSAMVDATVFVTKQLRSAGVVYKGRPTWHATVTAVDLDADPPSVTLSVCLASGGWAPVYQSSGRPFGALPAGPARQLKIARLTEQHGTWLLADEERQDRPC
jgi:hypothetical protein